MTCSLIFFSLLYLFCLSFSQQSPTPSPFPNAIKAPIVKSALNVYVRRFARIPYYNGLPAKIVDMALHEQSLYVSTGPSGGMVWKVTAKGVVAPWFNVSEQITRLTGNELHPHHLHGGVRSVAMHPSFNTTGLFYVSVCEKLPVDESKVVYLSKPKPTDTRGKSDSVLYEFRYSHARGRVVKGFIRPVLRVGLRALNHGIRQILFRGTALLVTHGDGAPPFAINEGGQGNNALGKILRIQPRKWRGKAYTIPKSNPFQNGEPYPPEVFALGFRNPHTLCDSRKHGLFVADVGRTNVEEINLVRKGENYGWAKREGTFITQFGGIILGLRPLPENDEKNNFTYPVAVFGHYGTPGTTGKNQAIAGSCPIENGSDLDGLFFYSDFAEHGDLYYSTLVDIKAAVTKGPPAKLTQATTYRPRIWYDHDSNPNTPYKRAYILRDIASLDVNDPELLRSDIRFGKGWDGRIFFSSKQSSRIYLLENSVRGWKKR